MRTFFGIIFVVITIGLVYVLDNPIGDIPALGKLLDPINGCWANAEPVNKDFNFDYKLSTLKGGAIVWFDERLVPHIRARNEHDLYYVQGYMHAYFRLWQMDMQARAAGGRISEVIGEKGLNFDRRQRRKGMVFGAENSLKKMEEDTATKVMMDAYIEGVNTFIGGLKYRDYPLEYKLMGFVPEKWNNLKISLLMKYMADDLTGYTEDIPLTYLRDVLTPLQFKLMYPETIEGSSPVIPAGTAFEEKSLLLPTQPDFQKVFPKFDESRKTNSSHVSNQNLSIRDEAEGTGSNNWAVGASKTKNGAAILCNDPHLMLNLPSLWYEVQLQTNDLNVYGASLPGAPGVVLGFNDSIAWGFTNNYRDVKDFYAIKTVPTNAGKYIFEGKEMDFSTKLEQIKIKGRKVFTDTVNYTLHGPVIYDAGFPEPGGYKHPLSLCWMAHRPSNDLKAIYLLNRADNYDQYVEALMNYVCPAQNIAYADRKGNVAIWGQGQFINKWKEQGRYIMDGSDSATLWKENIPMKENPHVFNPERGFVSSANQCVTDSTFPYWYNGYFVEFRAWRMNQLLDEMSQISVDDMFKLQNDTYSWLAANTLPELLKILNQFPEAKGLKYIDELSKWDYRLDAESKTATVFQIWWHFFYNSLWSDRLKSIPDNLLPLNETVMQLLKSGKLFHENLPLNIEKEKVVLSSYKKTLDSMAVLEAHSSAQWYLAKNTAIKHLAKLPAFGYENLKIGGWGNTINAAKTDHGPSWKLVVEMGKEINAHGIYPGGQSGNPGSKYYADFIADWAKGQYYKLLFLPSSDKQNLNDIKYIITFHP